MTSTRRLIYATLLALTALNFAPSMASAQVAQGTFTLRHDVRWQNASVSAGDYRFSYDASRPLGTLMLRRTDRASAGDIIMVPDTDFAEGSGASRIVLNSSAGGTYVSDMQLPDFGMTLHFNAPRTTEKEIATAAATSVTAAQ
jgi:hypothetical protein